MKKIPLALALFTFSLGPSSYATVLEPQSKLWLVGDSTLHAYTSTAGKIDFSSDISSLEQIKNGQMKKLDVSIPVAEMKSGEKGLDKNMQKSLKAVEHPFIKFHLLSYQTIPLVSDAQGFTINAKGLLEVAGVEKPIDLEANATPVDEGIRIKGKKEILMTDHNIKPPTMLFMKTKDQVVIHFDLILEVGSVNR